MRQEGSLPVHGDRSKDITHMHFIRNVRSNLAMHDSPALVQWHDIHMSRPTTTNRLFYSYAVSPVLVRGRRERANSGGTQSSGNPETLQDPGMFLITSSTSKWCTESLPSLARRVSLRHLGCALLGTQRSLMF